MSKKKDNKVNSDFDFDDSLDDFNFDFDFDEPKVKDDRKPILKALEGVRSGAKEAIKSSEFIKNAIKDTLPDGFGQTVDFADSTTQSLKSLYDESVKDVKPALKQFKASAAKLVPEDTKALPKSLKDMFNRWRKEADEGISSSGVNRESLMASVMKETFEAQAKLDQAQQQAAVARENLKEGISEVRFKSLMEAVGTAATSIVRIDQYNTGINFKYQQRSLELQYRQLFAMQDTMKFMAEDAQRRDSLLAAIAKNTMLPEFVKIKDSEARMQIAKTKLFESIIGGMYGKRNQYIENAIKGVKSRVMENARDLASGLREGAFQLDMLGGMSDMPGMDPYEIGGSLVGDQGTRWLGRLGGSWLKKKITGSRFDQRFGLSRKGTELERRINGLPNRLNEFRENPNYAWEGGIKNSFLAIMQGLMPSMSPDKSTVRLTGKDMDKPHFFTRRTDRSINEVIPGYLSRIFRELQVMRTGNENIGLTKFDHDSGDFVSAKRLRDTINSQIVDSGRQAALKRRLDDMLKMIDPNGTLSPEAKAGLMAKLVENSANVYEASEKRLGFSNAYTKVSADVGREISGQMGSFFATASSEDKLKFERLHNDLAGNMGDPRQYIQQQLDLGNQAELVRLGLINKQTGQIDLDKIQSMYLSFPESFAPQSGKRYNPYVSMANAVGEKFSQARQNVKDYVNNTVQETLKTARDVFIEGEEYPRIRKALLEAGKYKSAVTGKVISTIEELKEPIKDEDGNVIIDERELPKLVFYNAKDKIPTKLSELLGNTREKVTSSTAYQNASAVAKSAFAQAKDTFKKTLTSDPISEGEVPADVYVDGETEPRLTAVKMKLGHYFSKVSEKIISKPADIDGPVIDKMGQLLIDEDEVSRLSILNKFFGALSPLRLMGGIAKKFGRGLWYFQTRVAPKWAANNLKFLFKRIYGPILKTVGKLGWGAIKGTARFMGIMPNQDLYSKVTGREALIGRFIDAGHYISERTGKVIKSLKDIDGPIRDRAGKIVLSLEEFKQGLLTKDGQEATLGKLREAGESTKSALAGAWGRVSTAGTNFYQKVTSSMEDMADKKLKNMTPESMRDKIHGTYGQLRKRFGFSREQAEGMETRSLLSQIKDALVPKRKRKNSYEDMQERGLGNKLTGREGLAAKAAGLAAGKGQSLAETFGLDKLMGMLSGGKALFDTAKGGAGLLGSALKMGGALFGGAAATTAATAATGTVGAATATGGLLSTVGGGLIAAGSATLAFLTSPVVLGAAALALTAYGGYKAYQHFTRDNLSALGKLRMVQYGYLPTDTQHYVNAIDLENLVSDAVVFDKGGRAAVDYSKLEMSKMMSYFGLDFSTDTHKELFSHWYKTRFEPVFLTHMTALKTIADSSKLSSISDLTGEKKQKFFDAVKFPEGPYSFSVMPYPPTVKLVASTSKDVQAATAFVTEEMKKDAVSKSKKNALIPMAAAGAATAATSAKAVEAQKATASVLASKAAATSASALATRASMSNVDAEPKNTTVGTGGTANDPTFNAANGNFSTGQLATASGPVSDGRGSGAYLRYAPGVSMDNVNGQLRSQFYGAVEEYGRITGRSVTVTDGFRTFEEQARLKRLKGSKAAMPGTSMHEYGLAIDVDSKALDEMDKLGLLRKYGLTRPVGGEPWHLEAIGTQDNIALYKTDPSAATTAIMAGLGKGGGGLGTLSNAPDNTRSAEHSKNIMEANASMMKEPLPIEANSKLTRLGSTDGLAKIGFKPRQTVLPTGAGYVTPSQYGQIAQQAANNSQYMTRIGTTDSETMPGGYTSRPLQNVQNDPTMRVPDPTSSGYEGMRGTIVAASKLVGVDENLMLKTAAIESDFSAGAGASSSSAKGLYQFTDDTWKGMVSQYGKKYGFDESTSPMDPKASAIMAAHYFKDNIKAISASTKRPIGITEAYIGHLLGPGGASKFFTALDNTPDAIAAQLMPKAAAANTSIFYNGSVPRTVGEVYQEISNRINAKARKYGLSDSGALTASSNTPQMGFATRSTYASYQPAPTTTQRPPRMIAPMVPKMGFQSSMGAAYGNNQTEQQMQSSASVNSYTAAPSSDLMSKSVDIQSRILDVVSGMYELMKGQVDKKNQPAPAPAPQTTTYTPPKPMVDMNRTSMVA